MIEKLSIQNFKSIKDLQLECRRINLFIGEPNTGKSNILESLALFSFPYSLDLKSLVRISDLSNLFYENDLSNSIIVETNSKKLQLEYQSDLVKFTFSEDSHIVSQLTSPMIFDASSMHGDGGMYDAGIHPYFFKTLKKFERKGFDFLFPPNGDNLFSILQTNKSLKTLISDLIFERGFKLNFRLATYEIEISKEESNILTSYPFAIISDTLQRIIFYVAAMESNKPGITLVFEEPESNVFPYYTKFLAERIAMDENKQYFLTTHNPYFLQAIIEKTPINNLSINLVQMDKFKTKVTSLSSKSIEEILGLGSDVFLNFDKLLEETS